MTDPGEEERRVRNRAYNVAYRERHRETVRVRGREWASRNRAENHDAVRQRERLWEEANRERRRVAKEERRAVNREPDRERDRRRYAADPEGQRERARQLRRTNPQAAREASKRWREANREATYAAVYRRRQRRVVSMDRIDRMLSAFYRKAIRNDPCYYCGAAAAGRFHVDHYVPLALNGTDHWWNLVHACARCNQRKHAKHGDEFIASLKGAAS